MFKPFVLKVLIFSFGGVGVVLSSLKTAKAEDIVFSGKTIRFSELFAGDNYQSGNFSKTKDFINNSFAIEPESHQNVIFSTQTEEHQSFVLNKGIKSSREDRQTSSSLTLISQELGKNKQQKFLNSGYELLQDNIEKNPEKSEENQDRSASDLETEVELSPNPDPLQLPTKPGEVKIKNTVPLTLEEAIILAKANNYQLQITEIELKKAEAVLDQAKAALFPTLSLQAQGSYDLIPSGEINAEVAKANAANSIPSLKTSIQTSQSQLGAIQEQLNQAYDPSDPIQVQERIELLIARSTVQQNLISAQNSLSTSRTTLEEIGNFPSTSITGSINLNYGIYSPQRQANINFAKEQLRISELEVKRIESDLIRNVSLAYYDFQQANQQVTINRSDVESRSERLEGIKLLVEAALATRLDLLNAQVELDNSIQNLKNSQTQQEIAQRNLARLLNLPSSVTPTIADPIEIAGHWDMPLEETIILAFNNRVELQQQLAQRKTAEAQRQIALAGIRPSLDLFGSYSLLQFFPDGDDPTFKDLVSENFSTGYSVGVLLNWTFFDGGSAKAQAKQAEADIAIAEQRYGEQANTIRFEVEQSYFQLPHLLDNIETAKQSVIRAEEAVRAAQIRFSAAVNTQTEVLDAQTRLVQAQNNLLNAVLNYNRALAELKRAAGN